MNERTLDLRGLKCPMPALRTRKALAQATPGSAVVVACTDPMSQIDIPHLVAQTGDVLDEWRLEDGVFSFHLRKRRA